MPNFDQAFLRVSKEHAIMQEYVSDLRQVVESNDCRKLQKITENIRADFEDHFQIEEKIIFPAALLCLTTLETADLIITLSKEHGLFECDVQTIIQFVDCESKNNSISTELKVFLEGFINRLEKHAKREMDELFPKLDTDKRAQKIIQDLLKET